MTRRGIGECATGTAARLRVPEVDVSGKLRFTARIQHALLIAGTRAAGSWRAALATLPLGPGTA